MKKQNFQTNFKLSVYLRKKNLRKRNQKIAFKINGELKGKKHICPFTINKNSASIVIASQL